VHVDIVNEVSIFSISNMSLLPMWHCVLELLLYNWTKICH